MKLRLVRQENKLLLLCPNGSVAEGTHEVLIKLLTSFSRPTSFKGKDGCWNMHTPEMENVIGETVAYVDQRSQLIILDDNLYEDHVESHGYISATEYAELHQKSRATIKKLCAAGEILGAYKTSTGWLIPKNAPYPKRKVGRPKGTKKFNKV